MNIAELTDMAGTEYTLVITGDSVNVSVNGELLSLSKEQFHEVSEMAHKEWSGEKIKCYKCNKKHKGLCTCYARYLLSKVRGGHDS